MPWDNCRDPHHQCTPLSSTRNLSRAQRDDKMNGRGRAARAGGEVTTVFANQTVGPDGCRGKAIYVRWAGASQKEALTNCGRQGPRKEFLNAGVVKKTWKYWPGTVALYEICWFQKSTEHRGQSVIWLLAASWLANSADLWHSPHCSGPNYHLKNIYYFGHIFKQLIPTFFKISKRNFSHFVPWTAS